MSHLSPDHQLALWNFCSSSKLYWDASAGIRRNFGFVRPLHRQWSPLDPRTAKATFDQTLDLLPQIHPMHKAPLMLKMIRGLSALPDEASWLAMFSRLVAHIPAALPGSAGHMANQPLLIELLNQAGSQMIETSIPLAVLMQAGLSAAHVPTIANDWLRAAEEAVVGLQNGPGNASTGEWRAKVFEAGEALVTGLMLLPDSEKPDRVALIMNALTHLEGVPKSRNSMIDSVCFTVGKIHSDATRAACARIVLEKLPGIRAMPAGLWPALTKLVAGATPEDQRLLFDTALPIARAGGMNALLECEVMLQRMNPAVAGPCAQALAHDASDLLDGYARNKDVAARIFVECTRFLPVELRAAHVSAMLEFHQDWRDERIDQHLSLTPVHELLEALIGQVRHLDPASRTQCMLDLNEPVMLCGPTRSRSSAVLKRLFFEHVQFVGNEEGDRESLLDELERNFPLGDTTDENLEFSFSRALGAMAHFLATQAPALRHYWAEIAFIHSEQVEHDDGWFAMWADFAEAFGATLDTLPETALVLFGEHDDFPQLQPTHHYACVLVSLAGCMHLLPADMRLEQLDVLRFRRESYEVKYGFKCTLDLYARLLVRSPAFTDVESRITTAEDVLDVLLSEQGENYVALLGLFDGLLASLPGGIADKLLTQLATLGERFTPEAGPKVEEVPQDQPGG